MCGCRSNHQSKTVHLLMMSVWCWASRPLCMLCEHTVRDKLQPPCPLPMKSSKPNEMFPQTPQGHPDKYVVVVAAASTLSQFYFHHMTEFYITAAVKLAGILPFILTNVTLMGERATTPRYCLLPQRLLTKVNL